jgi:hypothetical protein
MLRTREKQGKAAFLKNLISFVSKAQHAERLPLHFLLLLDTWKRIRDAGCHAERSEIVRVCDNLQPLVHETIRISS